MRYQLKLLLTGAIINAFLAAVKIVAGIFGSSYALIADGIESSLDVLSSLVVFGGFKVALRPPDHEHPYGHGKAESLAALLVSGMLLAAGVVVAVQSIREILSPSDGPAPFTLAILVAVIVVKEGLFRIVQRAAQQSNSTALTADAWHHRSDAATSLAAFTGISIALIGGPDYAVADDAAALIAAGFIVWNGGRILVRALNEVMDASAPEEVERQIRNVAGHVAGVQMVEKCSVRKAGLHYHVDIHVLVDGELTVREGHEIARAVRRALRESTLNIHDSMVHVEPAGHHPTPEEAG